MVRGSLIYLLDTNILVFVLRRLRASANLNSRYQDPASAAIRISGRARDLQEAGHTVGVSAITVAELYFGAIRSQQSEGELKAIQLLMAPLVRFPFDAAASAIEYGRIRGHLESVGKSIGSLDTLIAAHAQALGAILVTNNVSEFSRVPGLVCEDWSS